MGAIIIRKEENSRQGNKFKKKLIYFLFKNQKMPSNSRWIVRGAFTSRPGCLTTTYTSKIAKDPGQCRRWRAEVIASHATCVYNMCRQRMPSNVVSRPKPVPRGRVNWPKVYPQLWRNTVSYRSHYIPLINRNARYICIQVSFILLRNQW